VCECNVVVARPSATLHNWPLTSILLHLHKTRTLVCIAGYRGPGFQWTHTVGPEGTGAHGCPVRRWRQQLAQHFPAVECSQKMLEKAKNLPRTVRHSGTKNRVIGLENSGVEWV
jgi:hypothetical protein